MKKLNHLEEIFNSYSTFIIDLWGVMHDGVKLNPKAVESVDHLIKNQKKVIFLSNAPRPSNEVRKFLRKLKMEERFMDNIFTSGQASMMAIENNNYGKFFFHLGPDKDDKIFFNIKNYQTSLKKCDYILCTGVFDEHEEDLEYYKSLLKDQISKKLICTNPDLIVHRGEKIEYCAGKIAEIFEELGGKAIYFGKPHREIYEMCFKKGEKVLAIGDNLNTDIRGANNMNIDSIFISNGVHRSEFKDEIELINLQSKYKVKANYYQTQLIW